MKIGKYGVIIFLKKFVKEFELRENELVEVIILDYYKFEELVSEKGKEFLFKF